MLWQLQWISSHHSIEAWLAEQEGEFNIELKAHAATLNANGITTDILAEVSDAEWKELIPQVGPRTVIKKAASEMSGMSTLDANLMADVDRARTERDQLSEQTQAAKDMNERYREQLNRCNVMVTEKMSRILEATKSRDDAKYNAMSETSRLSEMKREVAALDAQSTELTATKTTATTERDAAVQQAKALASYAGR